MNLDAFEASLEQEQPPPALGAALQALWWQAKGDWHQAHRLAQDDSSAEAAWVHAHLHRVEGDPSNAAYWYRRAERPAAGGDTTEEWRAIVAALL